MTKGNIEIPSDLSGVVFTKIDDEGAWKHTLHRELTAAGFNLRNV